MAKELLLDIKQYHFYIKLDNTIIDKIYKWNMEKQNFATFCSIIHKDLDELVRINGFQNKNGVITKSNPQLSFTPQKQNISVVEFKFIYRKYNNEDVFYKIITIDDDGHYIEGDEKYYHKAQSIPNPSDYIEDLESID